MNKQQDLIFTSKLQNWPSPKMNLRLMGVPI